MDRVVGGGAAGAGTKQGLPGVAQTGDPERKEAASAPRICTQPDLRMSTAPVRGPFPLLPAASRCFQLGSRGRREAHGDPRCSAVLRYRPRACLYCLPASGGGGGGRGGGCNAGMRQAVHVAAWGAGWQAALPPHLCSVVKPGSV